MMQFNLLFNLTYKRILMIIVFFVVIKQIYRRCAIMLVIKGANIK